MMKLRTFTILLGISLFITTLPTISSANIIDDLKKAIQSRRESIEEIDKEIRHYETQVHETQTKRLTLEEQVNQLKKSQNQLSSEINQAQRGVNSLESSISDIQDQIREHEANIRQSHEAIVSNLRKISIADEDSIITGLLKYEKLSEYWSEVEITQQLAASLSETMRKTAEAKASLENIKAQQEQEIAHLEALQEEIEIKKTAIDIAKAEQDKLLSETKNQEASYQAILEEKRQAREAFEQDLAMYESQLNLAINPDLIPAAEPSTLAFPLDDVRRGGRNQITQFFGNTQFAQSGAYNGKGHNGVDMDLETGDPVRSAGNGTVRAVGDTDLTCPRASFGKWVLIDHTNGLTTLYAHLSGFAVSSGQAVSRGQVIGYGGNTGYSLGSHLHFMTYASDGVVVDTLPSRSCPGTAFTVPLADYRGYLNPMEYLPPY